jgi:hypothetical protein
MNAPPMGELAVGVDSVAPAVGAPACVTATVVVPIVNTALRAAPLFAETLYCTVPLPLPDAPAVIATKLLLLAAVHVQPAFVVTVTDPVPPLSGYAVEPCAATVYVQVGAGLVGVVLSFEHATAPRTVRKKTARQEQRRITLIGTSAV